jgi:predicted permease
LAAKGYGISPVYVKFLIGYNKRSADFPVQATLNVALPIFGIILAGCLAGRWRILGGEAAGALNAFVSYFALPGPVLFFGTLCLAAFGNARLPPAMLTIIVTAIVSMVFGVTLIELEVAAGHGPHRAFLRAAINVARNPLPLSIALGIWSRPSAWHSRPPPGNGSTCWAPPRHPVRCLPSASFFPTSRWRSPWCCRGSSIQPRCRARSCCSWRPCRRQANAFALARQFDIAVEQSSAAVLLSTAFSVITVSALLVWLRVA